MSFNSISLHGAPQGVVGYEGMGGCLVISTMPLSSFVRASITVAITSDVHVTIS